MVDEPRSRFPIEQWQLVNGLTIVLQPDPAAPLIASTMCYAAGSRCDPDRRRGLAHLCEHLAFHGPRVAAGRGFPERIESVGGMAQAVTMADRTCFSAVFPRHELPAVLAVEAERLAVSVGPPDPAALEIQRRILLAELRERSERRVHAGALERVHRLLYPPEHPYCRPPTGEPDGIRAVTAGDVEAFFAAHLRPSNAVLVLVGDLSPGVAAEHVRRRFEALPAGPAPAPAAAEERRPPAAAPGRLAVSAAVAEARTQLAWSVSGFGHEGWYRAALLMRGLAAGRSSPLARELVERAGLAQEVRGSLVAMRDASTLVFEAVAAPGVDGRRLEEGLLTAADLLLARGLSAAQLLRARKRALTDHYFVVQYLDRRADLCAALACYLGAPERLPTEPLRYSQPDQDAVAGFAGRLRQEAARAVLSLVPEGVAA
jgi:zinc protease